MDACKTNAHSFCAVISDETRTLRSSQGNLDFHGTSRQLGESRSLTINAQSNLLQEKSRAAELPDRWQGCRLEIAPLNRSVVSLTDPQKVLAASGAAVNGRCFVQPQRTATHFAKQP
jgi:hypothetical protein